LNSARKNFPGSRNKERSRLIRPNQSKEAGKEKKETKVLGWKGRDIYYLVTGVGMCVWESNVWRWGVDCSSELLGLGLLMMRYYGI
jgi:hypothetical protein